MTGIETVLTEVESVSRDLTRIYLGGAESPNRGQYNVARDGRFLINTVLDDVVSAPITIVQNWRQGR